MKFFDLFPPPKILAMPAVGLHIGDTAIRFVELIKENGHFSVGRFGERKLPVGSVKVGKVENIDSVKAALISIRDEFQLEFVKVSIPEEQAYVFKTSIPKVSDSEIRGVVEFKLEENVPIDVRDAVFDYVIEPSHSSDDNHINVVVSVLPGKVVSDYVGILKSVGLTVLSFNIESQAISQAVLPYNKKGTYILVNFGEARTSISVVVNNIVHFVSTLAFGSNVLTAAIEKHFSVSTVEALQIKEDKGYIKNRKNMELFFSLMNTTAAIKDEINKIINYWQTHKDNDSGIGDKVEKIILCGRDSGIAGLDEYLSMTLKLPVEVGQPWVNVCSFEDYIPPINFFDSLDYAPSIGLALPKAFNKV